MAVITISRQFGAGAKTLGALISKKLDYTFYDTEIIQLVAKKAKVSPDWVEAMEDEAGSLFQKFLGGVVPKSLVDRILGDKHGYLDEEIYVDLLHHIISKIAEKGKAVIIGRGSQYILSKNENTFHVLLVADIQDRIRFMETHYDLMPKQASHVVQVEDKRRTNLYKKFNKQDYDQPVHYHMVANMSKLDLNQAAELVCSLVTP